MDTSQIASSNLQNTHQIPDNEIDPRELDFTNSIDTGTYRTALWHGTEVAVRIVAEEALSDDEKVRAFQDELALLRRIRHPNVVDFLGAITQSAPMMIVTEHLPRGDLRAYLNRVGALSPVRALEFALDIARGLNYLHEHRPEAIFHGDLEPLNIMRDNSGQLKVFGKTMKAKNDTSRRYVAPEVYRNEEYGTEVDVFSFALIVQEMIEGCPPFPSKHEDEVPKAYAAHERPPFRAPPGHYAFGLKELIEECWSEEPFRRPEFRDIIPRLEHIIYWLEQKSRQKMVHRKWCGLDFAIKKISSIALCGNSSKASAPNDGHRRFKKDDNRKQRSVFTTNIFGIGPSTTYEDRRGGSKVQDHDKKPSESDIYGIGASTIANEHERQKHDDPYKKTIESISDIYQTGASTSDGEQGRRAMQDHLHGETKESARDVYNIEASNSHTDLRYREIVDGNEKQSVSAVYGIETSVSNGGTNNTR